MQLGVVLVIYSFFLRSVPTFAYVTSVVILRDGKDVASITPFTPATAILDKASLNVTGAISTSSG